MPLREWFTVPKAEYRCLFSIIAPYNTKLATKLRSTSFQLAYSSCDKCSLQKPAVWWLMQNNHAVPYESPTEMKQFEKRLTERRLPFDVLVKIDPDSDDSQRVSVRYLFYPDMLAHQASTHLPSIGAALNIDTNELAISQGAEMQVQIAVDLKYRFNAFKDCIISLNEKIKASTNGASANETSASEVSTSETSTGEASTGEASTIKESDTYLDPQGIELGSLQQPSGFHGQLSPLQVQSLRDWLDREYKPKPFIEIETEESIQPHLNIRLVGRAERTVNCRGGVIADDVGYGKTVVSLALMQFQEKFDSGPSIEQRMKMTKSCIHVKATLVISPPHLVAQWKSEAAKFRGIKIKPDILILNKFADLQLITAADIEASKIIIANEDLFASQNYRVQLGKYSCRGGYINPKDTGSRRAQEWYESVLVDLDRHIEKYLHASGKKQSQSAAIFRDQAREIKSEKEKYEKARSDLQAQLDEATRSRSQWKNMTQKDGQDEQNEGQTEGKGKGRTSKGKPMSTDAPLDHNKLFYRDVPLLEYFSFARVVYDEFSYENPTAALFVSKVRARSKWVLSATPPTRDLAAVCKTASLLGIHVARPLEQRLGLPLITVGPPLSAQTSAEKVLSYGKVQSDQDVRGRQKQGETFLRHFSSTNPVDKKYFGELSIEENVIVTSTTSTETIFYLYAQHVLHNVALDSDTLSKASRLFLPKIDDRKGMNGYSASGYHLALAASCCPPNGKNSESSIVSTHQKLLDEAQHELKKYFDKAIWLCRRVTKAEGLSSQVHEIVKDFYVLVDGLWEGEDFKNLYGHEAFQFIFESVFPGHSTVKSVEGATCQGLRFKRGARLVEELYKVRRSNWPEYFYTTATDVKSMKEDEIASLADDIQNEAGFLKNGVPKQTTKLDESRVLIEALDTSLNQARSERPFQVDEALRHLGSLRTSIEPALNQTPVSCNDPRGKLSCYVDRIKPKEVDYKNSVFDDTYPQQTIAQLNSQRELRGMRTTTGRKADIVEKLRRDDDGTLENEAYVEGKFVPLRKRIFPRLDLKYSKRNATITASHDDFVMTTDGLDVAISHAIEMMRQKKIVETLVNPNQASCRTCGSSSNLHLVYKCGHVLCEKHLRGWEWCGESGAKQSHASLTPSQCPCILEEGAIPFSKLRSQDRVLDHSHAGLRVPSKKVQAGAGLSSKSAMIINTILCTPEDEGVILFAQYSEHYKELEIALRKCEINYTADPQKVVRDSSNKSKIKVLLLMLESSESAGTNLQYFANHVMFASPLNKDLQETYDSLMKQARGRCVRFGQKKQVKLYHFVTEFTIEVDMLELRQQKSILVKPGQAIGVFKDNKPKEEASARGCSDSKTLGATGCQTKTCDEEGDAIMEGTNENKTSRSSSSSPDLNSDAYKGMERVDSFLNSGEVWRAMNERNWLTTVGLSR